MALSLARSSVMTSSLWFNASSFLANLFSFQLPGIHLLEVLFVVLAVSLKLGPLEGKLARCRLSALLQLGTPVAEAPVFGLQRLPLLQDCRLSLMKSLMGTR
jgi:hypothetical protein